MIRDFAPGVNAMIHRVVIALPVILLSLRDSAINGPPSFP